MAKKLQLEITENLDTDKIESKKDLISNFELNTEIVVGTLTSNAKELSRKINEELKNYSVDKYIDNPDAAKSDKATLNKVEDTVAKKRKEITEAWNQPLEEFLYEMKTLEKSISDVSNKINEIVKEAENEEKSKKKQQIEQFWSTLNFNLISLDKIFNPKWLNKTYKLDQVMRDCDELVEKITSELTTIKSMADEDSETLQAFYLETLDLNLTLQKGNQLKTNRAKLKESELQPAICTITTKENAEKNGYSNPENIRSEIEKADDSWRNEKLAENDPIMDYNLILHGPKSKLIMVRKYMESLGVTYTKVVK